MKKNVIRKLGELAGQLPQVMITRTHMERVTYEELMKQGVTHVEGRPISKHHPISNRHEITQPVDHLQRLKKAFAEKGDAGVSEYCGWAHRTAAEQRRAAEQKSQQREKVI